MLSSSREFILIMSSMPLSPLRWTSVEASPRISMFPFRLNGSLATSLSLSRSAACLFVVLRSAALSATLVLVSSAAVASYVAHTLLFSQPPLKSPLDPLSSETRGRISIQRNKEGNWMRN
jgi:hypothetical protein